MIILKILLTFLICIIFSRCSLINLEETSYHNLSITLDTSFHYDIFDYAYLTQNDIVIKGILKYDTINRTKKYYWDSIPSGNYFFKIQTIFYKQKQFPVLLNSDTSFSIKKIYNYTDIFFNKNELLNADTIECSYVSKGCFHFNYDNSIITYKGNDFVLNINSSLTNDKSIRLEKHLNSAIIDSLYNFVLTLKKEKEQIGSNDIFHLSTSSEYIYLKIRNEVYKLNNHGLIDATIHDKFRKAIMIKEEE